MTIVWVWTISHAIGLGVQSTLVYLRFTTYRYSMEHKLGNGSRKRILRGHIRSGISYWLMHAIFLYTGLRVLIGFDFGAIPYLFVAAGWILVLAGLANLRDWRILSR